MTNEKELTHIDLFSGIGGFTLAAEWAGFETIVFCEKERFCQEVLKKRFGAFITKPKSTGWTARPSKGQTRRRNQIPLISEIRDFNGTKYRGATLLTGGFPCQPFSVAGQRRGKEDDRYLWPEMFRVIKETKPRWVVAENVTGIVKLALGQVLSDLESIGYDFPRDHKNTPIVPLIPACSLNAPHRRYRVWIIAHTRCQHGKGAENEGKSRRQIFKEKNASLFERSTKDGEFGDAPDSKRGNKSGKYQCRQGEGKFGGHLSKTSTNPRKSRLEGSINKKRDNNTLYNRGQVWQENWFEVATRFCRVDDGVSDRVHRLKALGNAIVPQIAYEILKNIAWIERQL